MQWAVLLCTVYSVVSTVPHIILFVVDDQGWANTGYHNQGPQVQTPNMDALAHDGVRLDRHYVFRWCAPTRSALMTGRLPYHVLESTNYVAREFTMMPAKLKQVGYSTHQVGKWHLGELKQWMTPHSRGFDTSLGYLAGGEDHWTQRQKNPKVFGCPGVDLYKTDEPAYGHNGTYGSFIYNAEVQRVLSAHNGSTPLFMYIALQTMHAPQEVPKAYSDKFPSPTYSSDYAIMQGMGNIADEVLGNTTDTLRRLGLWDNTLIIYTSDNGGPAGKESSGHSGNNFPLRGGKITNWEGGIRVSAFLSGGRAPNATRGKSLDGYIHGCDWYPTVCKLAGVDPSDDKPGIPPIDGMDMWPYLSGQVDTSPRTEMLISSEDNGALISGDYKLILGEQAYGFWQGPVYPNASTNHNDEHPFECGSGCLFNIRQDPSEYNDLASSQPEKLKEMKHLFQKLNATKFPQKRMKADEKKCEAYRAAHHGFVGPSLG